MLYQTFFLNEYSKLALYLLISAIIVSFILFLSLRLTINNPDSQKLSIYECGFEPYGDARDVFDVRFYLVAILFLVFDLETVYFFPWIISFTHLTSEGFWFMIDFIIELLVGYIYAWKMGALNWK